MRMLVISDLHANWPALEAVLAAEPHDHLLVHDLGVPMSSLTLWLAAAQDRRQRARRRGR